MARAGVIQTIWHPNSWAVLLMQLTSPSPHALSHNEQKAYLQGFLKLNILYKASIVCYHSTILTFTIQLVKSNVKPNPTSCENWTRCTDRVVKFAIEAKTEVFWTSRGYVRQQEDVHS